MCGASGAGGRWCRRHERRRDGRFVTEVFVTEVWELIKLIGRFVVVELNHISDGQPPLLLWLHVPLLQVRHDVHN